MTPRKLVQETNVIQPIQALIMVYVNLLWQNGCQCPAQWILVEAG